tara:strand:+ start:1389 stop:2192 length:804 start_codon:yes stop_codon:yes gene_type:complete
MSRTQRRGGTSSPIKNYLQFSASTGTFNYYDKELKERVELEKLSIILLDSRGSVSGYNQATKAQITSNLVADVGKEVLTVMSWKDKKSTEIAKGIYKTIKPIVNPKGGKFTTNLICLADLGTGNGLEISNLQFQGSSLNGWINFVKTLDSNGEYDSVVKMTRGALSKQDGNVFSAVSAKEEADLIAKIKKNPRTPQPIWFYVMEFETEDLTEDQIVEADQNDATVQEYFKAVGGAAKVVESVEEVEEEEEGTDEPVTTGEDEDEVPF